MKKKLIQQLLLDYIDGTLDERRKEEIESLLETRQEYQELYKNLLALKSDLASLKKYSPSPFFAQRVLAEHRQRRQQGFWQSFNFLPRRLVHAALITSVILLLLSGWPHFFATETPQQNDAILTSEDILINTDALADQSLSTDDQALQFALMDKSLNEGE